MNTFDAIGIAEGFIECEDEKKIIAAWQHLIDTGLCWELQGWFGRNAVRLIEEGICSPPGGDDEESVDIKGDSKDFLEIE